MRHDPRIRVNGAQYHKMQSGISDIPSGRLHDLIADVLARDPAVAGFEVHYQPIVRLDDNAIVAVEAPAR